MGLDICFFYLILSYYRHIGIHSKFNECHNWVYKCIDFHLGWSFICRRIENHSIFDCLSTIYSVCIDLDVDSTYNQEDNTGLSIHIGNHSRSVHFRMLAHTFCRYLTNYIHFGSFVCIFLVNSYKLDHRDIQSYNIDYLDSLHNPYCTSISLKLEIRWGGK